MSRSARRHTPFIMEYTQLLISLGPVQDFIAAARKCQDLWFGSYMLSELSRAVARSLPPDSIIFPGSTDDDTAVANKILARLSADMDPAAIARQAEQAMESRLLSMAEEAWPDSDEFFLEDVARAQLAELMEFFWVSVPESGSYGSARRQAERLLTARKATKTWGPLRSASIAPSGSRKSTLDGIRESVIRESAFRSLSSADLHTRFGMKPSERLCGIAMIKRRGVMQSHTENRRPRFHSTSHMAASPLLVRLARDPSSEQAVRDYLDMLDGVADVDLSRHTIRCGSRPYADAIEPPPSMTGVEVPVRIPRAFDLTDRAGTDGVVFFENRLQPDIFVQSATPDPKRTASSDLSGARTCLQDLLRQSDISTLCPYYAMLIADGDRMGELIDRLGASPQGIDEHRLLSRQLDAFSGSTRSLVENHGGSLIYAGGDDVMALLPLHTALACADRLRLEFTRTVQIEGMPEPATLSVGMAFVHHLLPMDKARSLARTAERNAKDKAGRDALGIVLDKRSGATLAIHDKWTGNLRGRLEQWVELLREGRLPHGVAFELESMIAPFQAPSEGAAEFGPVIAALSSRIVARKRSRGGEAPIDQAVATTLRSRFENTENPLAAVEQLSFEIQVARLLLDAYEIAWGEIERGHDA